MLVLGQVGFLNGITESRLKKIQRTYKNMTSFIEASNAQEASARATVLATVAGVGIGVLLHTRLKDTDLGKILNVKRINYPIVCAVVANGVDSLLRGKSDFLSRTVNGLMFGCALDYALCFRPIWKKSIKG